jgi:COMPASS component SWD2
VFQTKLKPAKIFKAVLEPTPPSTPSSHVYRSVQAGPKNITGITFDDRGDLVVTAGEDETFRSYNCKTGKQVSLLLTCLFPRALNETKGT